MFASNSASCNALDPARSWATFWPLKKIKFAGQWGADNDSARPHPGPLFGHQKYQSSQGESNYLHFRSTALGAFFWQSIEKISKTTFFWKFLVLYQFFCLQQAIRFATRCGGPISTWKYAGSTQLAELRRLEWLKIFGGLEDTWFWPNRGKIRIRRNSCK